MGAASLEERARAVEAELRHHKSALRRHRQGARDAAIELSKLKAECDRLGIALHIVPDAGPGRSALSGRA